MWCEKFENHLFKYGISLFLTSYEIIVLVAGHYRYRKTSLYILVPGHFSFAHDKMFWKQMMFCFTAKQRELKRLIYIEILGKTSLF